MDPEAGPHAHWHVPGLCDHLTISFRAGCEEPPAYWLLAPTGYWFSYCMACTAASREIGAVHPDLAPLRITTYAPDGRGLSFRG